MKIWALILLLLGSPLGAAPPMRWESLMLIKAAAEKGDPEAQFLLGLQYKVGDGVDRDPVVAAKWISQAAAAGHAEAKLVLKELRATTEPRTVQTETMVEPAGLPQDTVSPAPVGGVLPDKTQDMAEDPAETMRWSVLLSGLRGAEAFLLRGVMLENGIGVNRDHAAAVQSYRQAAERGLALGQYHLGLMYAEGKGVERDLTTANVWLSQAVENGWAEAKTDLEKYRLMAKSSPGSGVDKK